MALATMDLEALFNESGIKNREVTKKYLDPLIADDCFTEYEISQFAMAFDQGYSAALQAAHT